MPLSAPRCCAFGTIVHRFVLPNVRLCSARPCPSLPGDRKRRSDGHGRAEHKRTSGSTKRCTIVPKAQMRGAGQRRCRALSLARACACSLAVLHVRDGVGRGGQEGPGEEGRAPAVELSVAVGAVRAAQLLEVFLHQVLVLLQRALLPDVAALPMCTVHQAAVMLTRAERVQEGGSCAGGCGRAVTQMRGHIVLWQATRLHRGYIHRSWTQGRRRVAKAMRRTQSAQSRECMWTSEVFSPTCCPSFHRILSRRSLHPSRIPSCPRLR